MDLLNSILTRQCEIHCTKWNLVTTTNEFGFGSRSSRHRSTFCAANFRGHNGPRGSDGIRECADFRMLFCTSTEAVPDTREQHIRANTCCTITSTIVISYRALEERSIEIDMEKVQLCCCQTSKTLNYFANKLNQKECRNVSHSLRFREIVIS